MRLAMVLIVSLISMPVFADDENIPIITDQLTKNECSACHFAFPASMLPEASWKKIMGNLENHFGEDASLDTQTTQHISEYLNARAGDKKPWSSKFVRGLDTQNPPIRITETKYWIKRHPGIAKDNLQSGLAISKARCTVCHRQAEDGDYQRKR